MGDALSPRRTFARYLPDRFDSDILHHNKYGMTLFHITCKSKITRILREGIQPRKSRGISKEDSHREWVWLTDNPDYILQTQAGRAWARQNTPTILEVDATGLRIEPHITDAGEIVPHEYKYKGTIDTGRIKLG